MAQRVDRIQEERQPLSRERIFETALRLADEGGIAALSMRKLAAELGVEAMSLYHYVKNKDELLEGLIDRVFSEIKPPVAGKDPLAAIRASSIAYHASLRRHPWSHAVTGSPERVSPARLQYMEALLGCLRKAGFSAWMTHHAYHILESHVVGSTLWEAGITAALSKGSLAAMAKTFMERLSPNDFPYIYEHIEQHTGKPAKADQTPFELGLDLILEGLSMVRSETRPAQGRRKTLRTSTRSLRA